MRYSKRTPLSVVVGWLLMAVPIGAVTPPPNSPLPTNYPNADQYGDLLPDGAAARLGKFRFRPGPGQCSALSPNGKWLATGGNRDRSLPHHQGLAKKEGRATLWDLTCGLPVAEIEIPGANSINELHFRNDGKQLAAVVSRQWIDEQRERRQTWVVLIDVQSHRIVDGLSAARLNESYVSIEHFDAKKGMLMQTDRERQTGVVEGIEEGDEDDEPEWNRRQADPLLLWRPGESELIRLYDQQEEFFAASNGRVFSLIGDRIQLIDPGTREVLAEWKRPSRASYPKCVSWDGKILVAMRPRKIRQADKTCREFAELVVCEANKAPRVIEECELQWGFDEFSFSRDDQFLFAMHDPPRIKDLKAWRVSSGECLWTMRGDFGRHAYSVHPDQNLLAVFECENGAFTTPCIHLLDAKTGRQLGTQPCFGAEKFEWMPDGKHIVAIGASVQMFDSKTLRPDDSPAFRGHNSSVQTISMSPNQRWVATLDGGDNLRVWDGASGHQSLPTDPGATIRTRAFAFVQGGEYVATIGLEDTHLRVYHCATGKLMHDRALVGNPADPNGQCTPVHDVAFNLDGTRLAAVAGGEVQLWDTRLGTRIASQPCHESSDSLVEFSPNGGPIALSIGQRAKCWNPALVQEAKFWNGALAEPVMVPSLLGVPLSFSADGNRFAFRRQDSLEIWDVPQGKVIFSIKAPSGEKIPFRLALAGDRLAVRDAEEKIIRVLDVRTTLEVRIIHDVEWAMFHFAAGASSDLFLAETISTSREHALIDLHTGRTIVQLSAPHSVWAVSPDGRIIAHGFDDIALIEVATGAEIGVIPGTQAGVTSLAFSPDGHTLITGGRDTTGLVWDWPSACKLRTERPRRIDDAWATLRAEDAKSAYATLVALKESPREAIALLRQELQPASAAEIQRIDAWIRQLDDDSYSVRATAERELSQRAGTARAQLEVAFKRRSSPETERRLRALLQATATSSLSKDEIRQVRAIQALEWIATREARNVLRDLTSGEALALTTREAKASLQRMR